MESRSVVSSQAELAASAEARAEPSKARSGSRRPRNQRPGNRRAEVHAAARAARRAAMPPITYPPELPVSQRKDEIARAIKENQVVIIAGETGSGKTTQIPKICLELGRGVTGQILGIWVVLPEPVSPAMITTWFSLIARAISSLRWLTGSSGG